VASTSPCSPRRIAGRGQAGWRLPTSYSEDPAIDAKVWEMLHVAHVFERAASLTSFTTRPICAARLLAASGDAGGDDDPWLLLGTHPASLQGVTTIASIMSRSATPTAIPTCAMRRRSTRYPAGGLSFRPARQRRLLFFGRIHRTRGGRAMRWHVERVVGWSWPASSRIRLS